MISILSETDPIMHWLKTPLGHFVSKPTYGNNLEELLFLNNNNIQFGLDSIVDKIKLDLGISIASRIKQIELLQTKYDDTKIIKIIYTDGSSVIKELENGGK